MLYCLFHFDRELRSEYRRESVTQLWIAPKLIVVPLQFIEHTRIVMWTEGGRDHALSRTDSESLGARTARARKKHHHVAA
jgi:hypothetical protein